MAEFMMQKKSLKNGIKSMEYRIIITSKARSEIENIFDYIASELKNKNAAIRLKNKIKKNIRSLKKMPQRFAEIEKKNNLNNIYRRIVVDNYVILYTVNEKEKLVYIAHIYYGKTDYL